MKAGEPGGRRSGAPTDNNPTPSANFQKDSGMRHMIHGRLICEAAALTSAQIVCYRLFALLGLSGDITVAEPFGENPDFFELVFSAPLPTPAPANPMAWFEAQLEKVEGPWQDKMLNAYQGPRYQCSAVLDRYGAPKDGIAWLSLSLLTE